MFVVLTGEEIPDLFQKLASEHPDTDQFVRDVNKYHRQEEARHLAFARMILPELWEEAGFFDRMMVKHIAPLVRERNVRRHGESRCLRDNRTSRMEDVAGRKSDSATPRTQIRRSEAAFGRGHERRCFRIRTGP